MTQPKCRVVITGIGMISPIGNCRHKLWENISSGKSGVGHLQRVPSQPLPTNIAAEATEFTGDISEFGELDKKLKRNIKKGLKLMCREIQMGVAAAQLALADANIEPGKIDPIRIGTMYGSDYIITEPFEFSRGVLQCMPEDRCRHLKRLFVTVVRATRRLDSVCRHRRGNH